MTPNGRFLDMRRLSLPDIWHTNRYSYSEVVCTRCIQCAHRYLNIQNLFLNKRPEQLFMKKEHSYFNVCIFIAEMYTVHCTVMENQIFMHFLIFPIFSQLGDR